MFPTGLPHPHAVSLTGKLPKSCVTCGQNYPNQEGRATWILNFQCILARLTREPTLNTIWIVQSKMATINSDRSESTSGSIQTVPAMLNQVQVQEDKFKPSEGDPTSHQRDLPSVGRLQTRLDDKIRAVEATTVVQLALHERPHVLARHRARIRAQTYWTKPQRAKRPTDPRG